jgi:signal transduction histidine kinase/ActR/RegA family two-component response regulator
MSPNAEKMDVLSLQVAVSSALQDIINGGILTTDGDLRITGWNHWLEINTRRPASSVLGRSLLEVYPDLVTRRLDESYRKALAGQIVVLSQRMHKYVLPMSATVARAGHVNMQQSARIAPLIEEGHVLGTLTLIEDVTERAVYDSELAARTNQQAGVADLGRQALAGEQLAKLTASALRIIAETVSIEQCAVFELDSNKKTLAMTAGTGWLEGIAGQRRLELASESRSEFGSTTSRSMTVCDVAALPPGPLHAALAEHGAVCAISVPVMANEACLGVLGLFGRTAAELLPEDVHVIQAVANVIGLAIDARRLEHALRDRVDQLAIADQRKDEFLAMLAHELRNPLAPILSAMDFLKLDESRGDSMRTACDVIERQVNQMRRLIDDLLDIARITQGKISLQKEIFDAAMVAAQAVEISRPLIEAGRHELSLSLPSTPQWILGDPTRIAQVLANLLNNAAKYTDPGGQLSFSVERREGDVQFTIRDSGVGIPSAMLSHVFDLFTQVNRSLDRAQGGLGIGLTLVRRIVELHGGSVHAFSEGVGKGSEFVIRLPPVDGENRPEAKTERTPADATQLRSLDILVVDDNVDAARILALLLKAFGHNVRTAASGLAAIDAAKRSTPDVIFLDIGLPEMDGFEVARQLRASFGPRCPLLVALTGYGRPDDLDRSREAGFSHHLTKPVEGRTLQQLLDRQMAGKQVE